MDMQNQYLAIANVLWQQFDKTYEPDKALKIGTIFPELDKPFVGRKHMEGGNYKWQK
ncbi:MAG: spore coat associated protein CotJA [Agathobacter sp.]|nr:spore coat associated protein CotJA [Agathobacter sp.]MDY3797433.1 spore coat associated protein CotJA [Agathobacter sp.]